MIGIDEVVVRKEIDCFNEGYRAGIADFITALTFNDLQITHAQIIDCEAINEKRKVTKHE